jgi:hypothetical protein
MGDLPDILIPVTAAEVLISGGYDVVRLAVGQGGGWARFKTADEVIVSARLTSGTYPDVSSVLEVPGEPIFLPATLIEPVKRACIFARREHRVDEEVEVTLRPNQIILRANCDGATFEEVIREPGQTATAKFQVAPEFLLATLGKGDMIDRCVLGPDRIGFIGEGWRHIVALRV